MIDLLGHDELVVPARGERGAEHADLVGLLADMDGRLRAMQLELASVAIPGDAAPRAITRMSVAQRSPAARALARDGDAPAAQRAQAPAPRRVHATRRITPVLGAQMVVQRTILEAEDESRRVVEDARQQIAEIGARTRAQLESALAEQPAPATAATASQRHNRFPRSARNPKRRDYDGHLSVEAGPFQDIRELVQFEDALASVGGVADVAIQSFEHPLAIFDVSLSGPTPLIAELQASMIDRVDVVEAGEHELRVEIVRAAAPTR